MAWIDIAGVRRRVPREGEGVEDGEIEENIASAIEEVVGILGSDSATSDLAISAVANLAVADTLDIINPRDARDRDSEQNVLRASAERKMERYLTIKQSDTDPSTADVPAGYIATMGPLIVRLPDETY